MLRKFIPFSVEVFSRRCKFIILLINLPALHIILAVAVMALLSGEYAFAASNTFMRIPWILCFVSMGVILLTIMLGAILTQVFSSLHKKYTYIEVSNSYIILSRYNGVSLKLRDNVVYRKLYVMPIADIERAERYGRGKMLITGNVRKYVERDSRLGYRITRAGLVFNNWWLNDNGYKSVSCVTIAPYFKNPQKIVALINKLMEREQASRQLLDDIADNK